MIYLFGGDDIKRKYEAYEKFIKSISKTAEIFHINKNDFNEKEFENFYSGRGLFFNTCTVVLTHSFENQNTRDFILKKLNHISQSPNDFIFLEDKLLKPVLDSFKKAKAELYIFEVLKEKKERFNSFLLANAFGNRDKLNLWIYFRQAMDKEVGMEELIGVLFWKAKDMLIKKNFDKFSQDELKDFTARLSCLLPKARSAGFDDESVFEQFLLEAF